MNKGAVLNAFLLGVGIALSASPLEAQALPSGLVISGYAKPLDDGTCSVDPTSTASSDELILDTSEAFTLRVALIVENTHTAAISPWRAEILFECDSSVLAPDPGPFIIPAFSNTHSFCSDQR